MMGKKSIEVRKIWATWAKNCSSGGSVLSTFRKITNILGQFHEKLLECMSDLGPVSWKIVGVHVTSRLFWATLLKNCESAFYMMQISGHLYQKLLECARDHRPIWCEIDRVLMKSWPDTTNCWSVSSLVTFVYLNVIMMKFFIKITYLKSYLSWLFILSGKHCVVIYMW